MDTRIDRSEVGSFRRLATSFEIALRARNLSARTVKAYLEAVDLLGRYLDEAGMPAQVSAITAEHLGAFLTQELERVSATSVHIRFRSLQQFFRWAVEDGEISVSPMLNMHPPIVPEEPIPVIAAEQLSALLKACSGTAFADRRDLAIIRLFIDSGCRRAEITNLTTSDIDLRKREATVTGKGRRVRTVAFGHKCAQSLDRYLRARDGHRAAHLPNLWLGVSGPLTDNGIAQIVRKRAKEAGISERINLHRFRHTYAHDRMAAGVEGENLMALAGWRSRSMLSRYGSSVTKSAEPPLGSGPSAHRTTRSSPSGNGRRWAFSTSEGRPTRSSPWPVNSPVPPVPISCPASTSRPLLGSRLAAQTQSVSSAHGSAGALLSKAAPGRSRQGSPPCQDRRPRARRCRSLSLKEVATALDPFGAVPLRHLPLDFLLPFQAVHVLPRGRSLLRLPAR
jgi:site-specific recombinase XerD